MRYEVKQAGPNAWMIHDNEGGRDLAAVHSDAEAAQRQCDRLNGLAPEKMLPLTFREMSLNVEVCPGDAFTLVVKGLPGPTKVKAEDEKQPTLLPAEDAANTFDVQAAWGSGKVIPEEDYEWLRDVHKVNTEGAHVISLHGNEDAPEAVVVYDLDHHLATPKRVYRRIHDDLQLVVCRPDNVSPLDNEAIRDLNSKFANLGKEVCELRSLRVTANDDRLWIERLQAQIAELQAQIVDDNTTIIELRDRADRLSAQRGRVLTSMRMMLDAGFAPATPVDDDHWFETATVIERRGKKMMEGEPGGFKSNYGMALFSLGRAYHLADSRNQATIREVFASVFAKFAAQKL